MLYMLNSFSTKNPTFSTEATFRTVLWYVLACLLPDNWTSVCHEIQTGTYLPPQEFAGSLQQWHGIGELCISTTKSCKIRLLRATGLAGFVFTDVPGLEIAHQQRFGVTCALNSQQCNPISTAESQICPWEFWGSEINKIHPGIMQCLISISNSSICNSRNLPLGKLGQYEDFTETNGDQRKPCWKLQSYPLGGLASLQQNNYYIN